MPCSILDAKGPQVIIKHLRCPGESNALLRIMLSWAHLGTGMDFPLLEWPENHVPHLECAWLQSLRHGLADIGGRIECYETFFHKPRRVHDSHIMDAICAGSNFTALEIRRINGCQLYLQVVLLSDIASPCGRYIDPAYYAGDRTNRPNWPTIQYPRQAKPDQQTWTLWHQALHQNHVRADKRRLRIPLGQWHPKEP